MIKRHVARQRVFPRTSPAPAGRANDRASPRLTRAQKGALAHACSCSCSSFLASVSPTLRLYQVTLFRLLLPLQFVIASATRGKLQELARGQPSYPSLPPHLPPFSFLWCCSSPSYPLRTHARLVCRAQIIFPASATAYAPCPAPSPSPASAPAPAPATTPAPAPDPSLALLPQFLFLIMLLLSQHKKKR
jgi:hypothetical protein